jgi:hypothetical protein
MQSTLQYYVGYLVQYWTLAGFGEPGPDLEGEE